MEFDPNSVKVNRIREETEYGGLRITADALVDTAKARIIIDFAFGDAVESGLLDMDLSVLHDLPARICALLRVRWSSPRNSRRWSCWTAPIFVVLAGLSLARILEGFGTRSCYPSALICGQSISFLLPPERTRRCRSSKEKERCRTSPTAAQVWGEADVPVCQRRRAERLKRSGGTNEVVLLRFGIWYSGSSSPGSRIWCRDSPRLPRGHLPNRSLTPSFLRRALREAQAHDD